MSKKVVLALSGGADSTVLLHKAAFEGYEIHTLSFDYGQRHIRELECIASQISAVEKSSGKRVINKILDVKYIREIAPISSITNDDIKTPDIRKIAGEAQPKSYVPYRNLMFISICAAYAESHGIETIWYGAAGDDSLAGYWDGDRTFVSSLNSVIGLNREKHVLLEAPLIAKSKREIIADGIYLGVNFANTWTCYSKHESGLADATTPSSSLRIKGFIDCGYRDPIQYIQQPHLEKLYEQHNCKDIILRT